MKRIAPYLLGWIALSLVVVSCGVTATPDPQPTVTPQPAVTPQPQPVAPAQPQTPDLPQPQPPTTPPIEPQMPVTPQPPTEPEPASPVQPQTPAQPLGRQVPNIDVPDGFQITYFVDPDKLQISNPRQIAIGDDGWVFVGSRAGRVYAVRDNNGEAQEVVTVASGLASPHGVAYHDSKLYIGDITTVFVVDDIINKLERGEIPVQPQPLITGLYNSPHHGTRHLEIGPDDMLYVSLGTPCNTCVPPDAELTGVIRRYRLDGGGDEVYARGIRNSVGFDWHPVSGDLWFTDNGSDWLGDELPNDELNRAPTANLHFGYPYCHQGDLPDPEYGSGRSCAEFTAPAQLTGPHVANLGIVFDASGDNAYIALHGSWNRSERIGYAVHRVTVATDKVTEYTPFAVGWLSDDKQSISGRPVDLAFTSTGDLLITDDHAGAIYRVTYP